MRLLLALGGAVAAFSLGAATGVCAVLVHTLWWGLPLAWAAVLATLAAVPSGWGRRFALAVGWIAAVGVLTIERSEGDYLVAGDVPGYLLLISGAVVLACGVSGLSRRRVESGGVDPVT